MADQMNSATHPLWFFVRIGVDGSLNDLTRAWLEYGATRRRLEARSNPPSASVLVAQDVHALLTVCREVRTTWPDELVGEWARLVHGGMWPARARDAVRFIHARPGEQASPRSAATGQRTGFGIERLRSWLRRLQSVSWAVRRWTDGAGG